MKEDKPSLALQGSFKEVNETKTNNLAKQASEFALESMNQRVFPNCHIWQSIRRDNLYIDKSLLILEIINSKNYVIARPRRWGKSTNLQMLKTFFHCPLTIHGKVDEIRKYLNRSLFIGSQKNEKQYYQNLVKNLDKNEINILNRKIKQQGSLQELLIGKFWEEKCQAYFSSYIVLKMSLFSETITKFHVQQLKVAILQSIQKFFNQHEYLAMREFSQGFKNKFERLNQNIKEKDENASAHQYIEFLSSLLQRFHYKKTIVLIDQYDHFLTSVLLQFSDADINRKDMLNCICKFISGFSKCETAASVQKVIATGIRHILYKTDFSPATIPISTITTSSPLHKYFGFTEIQVQRIICRKFKTQGYEKNIQYLKQTIKKLYNGYKVIQKEFGFETEISIYNPFSVGQYLNLCAETKFVHNEKQKQSLRKLGFWVRTGPNWRLIDQYITKLDPKNKAAAFYLFTTLMENYTQSQLQQPQFKDLVFSFSPQLTGEAFEALINKNTLQYQTNQFIHLLVTVGYLTVEGKKIKIPNQEMFIYYNQVLFEHMKRIVLAVQEQILLQNNLLYKGTIALHEWNACQQIFSLTIERCLKNFHNFCEALFKALMMIYVIASPSSPYSILYEKRFKNIQPDVIFVPRNDKKLPIIIHQHKRLATVEYNQVSALNLAHQALLQIIQRNYFKSVLEDQQYKQIQYQYIMIRGVVGHYSKSKRQFSIFAKQQRYNRRVIQMISQIGVFYLIDGKFPSAQGMVYPRLLDQIQLEKKCVADISQLSQLFTFQLDKFSVIVAQQNHAILNLLEDDIKSINYHQFKEDQIRFLKKLTAYLRMRYFGFENLLSDKTNLKNDQIYENEVVIFYNRYMQQGNLKWKIEDCRRKVKEMIINSFQGFRMSKAAPSKVAKGSPVKRLSSKIKA